MRQSVAALVAGLALSSCNPTATIHQRGGARTEGEILGSDHGALYVRTEKGKKTISRGKVTEIDHPGTTAMVTGVVLALGGLSEGVYAGTQWQETPVEDRNVVYTQMAVGGAVLITGVTLAIWGASVHGQSKQAAYPRRKAQDWK
jgi:hypothetical protein